VNCAPHPIRSARTSLTQRPHKLGGFHSRFRGACDKRGKSVPNKGFDAAFSKCPDVHSGDLEISARHQRPVSIRLGVDSHFSSSPTGTTVFLSYLSYKVRRPSPTKSRCGRRTPVHANRSGRLPLNSAGNLREPHRFSTRGQTRAWLQSRGTKDSHFRPATGCCRVWQERGMGFFN
jgi:hypothetical protein